MLVESGSVEIQASKCAAEKKSENWKAKPNLHGCRLPCGWEYASKSPNCAYSAPRGARRWPAHARGLGPAHRRQGATLGRRRPCLVALPGVSDAGNTSRNPKSAIPRLASLMRVRPYSFRCRISLTDLLVIGPIRPTRGHIATSPHGGLYAMPSLCGSAEATRGWFRAFADHSFLACRPL
jgi:hypothetical protein